MAINNDILSVRHAAQLDVQSREQHWLIRDLWMRSSIGLVGGLPKLGKSWLGLDMAVSVASATRCLQCFDVEDPGKALIYLAEDSLPMVRKRIEALCLQRGLAIEQLNLYTIDAPYLQLDLTEHASALLQAVESIRPRLLLLDPLIRVHRLEENSSRDMSGLLNYFRKLQRTFDTAVVLVHHASKKRRSHPGQAMRGSGDLHAFSDCALYLARKDDQLRLTVEHRSAAAPAPITLRLISRSDGSATHLEVVDAVSPTQRKEPLTERILEVLRDTSRSVLRDALRKTLHVNNQRLGEALLELQNRRMIRRTDEGWSLALSQSTPASDDARQRKLFK